MSRSWMPWLACKVEQGCAPMFSWNGSSSPLAVCGVLVISLKNFHLIPTCLRCCEVIISGVSTVVMQGMAAYANCVAKVCTGHPR
eukprot:1797802-Amphidinium_carterae.5